MLLLSCKDCGVNYFSAASAGTCPDCGAELEPGSPALRSVLDPNGDGNGSNGANLGNGEFNHLWQSLLGEPVPKDAL